MQRTSFSRLLPGLTVAVAALIAAPTAGAATLEPTSHNFGSQNVGSTSAPKAFTLTAGCNNSFMGICLMPEFVGTVVAITGDFTQTNNCPFPILVGSFGGTSCTINATFTPTAQGVRNGTLTAGGLSSSLTGTGVVPQTAQAPAGGVAGKKKKCKKAKKKPAAAAKKKCKKKKR